MLHSMHSEGCSSVGMIICHVSISNVLNGYCLGSGYLKGSPKFISPTKVITVLI